MVTIEQYISAKRIVDQYLEERKTKGYVRLPNGSVVPEYIDCGECVLCLIDKDTYFRPAGGWSIQFKEDADGKIICTGGEVPRLIGKELIPSTEEEYLKSNGGYVAWSLQKESL